jgi:hypothetical protein
LIVWVLRWEMRRARKQGAVGRRNNTEAYGDF